jgi:hypothetical protein
MFARNSFQRSRQHWNTQSELTIVVFELTRGDLCVSADLLPLRKCGLKPRPSTPNIPDCLRTYIVLVCKSDACCCHAFVAAEVRLVTKYFDGLLFSQNSAWFSLLLCLWHLTLSSFALKRTSLSNLLVEMTESRDLPSLQLLSETQCVQSHLFETIFKL